MIKEDESVSTWFVEGGVEGWGRNQSFALDISETVKNDVKEYMDVLSSEGGQRTSIWRLFNADHVGWRRVTNWASEGGYDYWSSVKCRV
jgi:hypothetical protein